MTVISLAFDKRIIVICLLKQIKDIENMFIKLKIRKVVDYNYKWFGCDIKIII